MVVDTVGDEIESTIEMFCSLSAGFATILLEENCALVVLIQNRVLMTIALRFEEIISPENDWHKIVCSN